MSTKLLADEILDAALELAEIDSWESMHLFDIAKKLDISLDRIRAYYPQKDDLVEAWFDRADKAVLSIVPSQEFVSLPETQRLHTVIMAWLDTLSPHRRLTREMLYYKLEFGHVHLQILGVLRISRTVQWFREAAHVTSTHFRRILEEVGTTGIYLATFSRWLFDDSPGSEKTRQFLENSLKKTEYLAIPFEFPVR